MTTDIRPEITKRSKYHINKHRYYELKHFCLQYYIWKREYHKLSFEYGVPTINVSIAAVKNKAPIDTIERLAIEKAELKFKMELIEKTAKDADPIIGNYIFKGVTEGLSFAKMKALLDVPCEKDMYYDRYRKFFWLLHNARN